MGLLLCFDVGIVIGYCVSIFCNTSSRTQISCRRSSSSASSIKIWAQDKPAALRNYDIPLSGY